jgi:ethanolamine ammonia-lyase small subunit
LAANRNQYLQNPNLGRSLDEVSAKTLEAYSDDHYTIAIIIADGLSATAVNEHAIPVIRLLLTELGKMKHSYSPVCLVEQGRVAIGDEIGERMNATISLVFIGERPGLSSPDSMGIYLTYQPKKGMTDEKRNCISNIRPGGLSYEQAVHQLIYLIRESLQLQLSGFNLKDQSGNNLLK